MGKVIHMTKKRLPPLNGGEDDRSIVEREIRRYRALAAVGWTDDLCECCRRKLWERAGTIEPPPGQEQQKTAEDGPI
jgi:hypothetical protein